MIFYDTGSWSGLVLRWKGTVISRIWYKVLAISVYVLTAYELCCYYGADLGATNRNVLGPTLSFLLVFRANNAYARYWQGRSELTEFFTECRNFISLALIFIPGGSRNLRWRWRQYGVEKPQIQKPNLDAFDQYMNDDDIMAGEERTHIIRWTLVLAVAFKIHVRIVDEGFCHGCLSPETKWLVDWDRFRIRHLLNAEEFRLIDGHVSGLGMVREVFDDRPFNDLSMRDEMHANDGNPPDDMKAHDCTTEPLVRLPVVVLYKLQEAVFRNMNETRLQDKMWAINERFIPMFASVGTKILNAFQTVTQVCSTPLPFPYFHLCRMLLILYFLTFPFFIDQDLGFWSNVGELSCLSFALLGVDAIATELENPFGDDDNDLDVLLPIKQLEQCAMLFLKLCGDHRAANNFVEEEFPPYIAEQPPGHQPVRTFLALRAQVESSGESSQVLAEPPIKRKVTAFLQEDEEEEDGDASDDS
eukprot:gnl/TRDRNA2_/TRDRNA2_188897_c0_seq1.p1 gnl/TRDRNA2_/TRDRNA2_188897_c0~~gnl/TRDRNA2_/TRDRNA2_188897_c0_seq1.p1  ORF type:complete len:473 (+),score=66.42 gnl/TRDRNA2_/TRDRNA2_188897_c0_seq1:72-1490(+)